MVIETYRINKKLKKHREEEGGGVDEESERKRGIRKEKGIKIIREMVLKEIIRTPKMSLSCRHPKYWKLPAPSSHCVVTVLVP